MNQPPSPPAGTESAEIREIDAPALNREQTNNPHLVLIDCREQDEWDAGHIPHAHLASTNDLNHQVAQLASKGIIAKDTPIVVNCRSGHRSQRACQFLLGQGYSNVRNLAGGFLGWQEEGFPVEGQG